MGCGGGEVIPWAVDPMEITSCARMGCGDSMRCVDPMGGGELRQVRNLW